MTVIQSLETTESFLVSFIEDEMARSPVGTDEIVLVGVVEMEVKDKDELTSFENDDLVRFML